MENNKCWVCLNCGEWIDDKENRSKAPFCGECGTKMIPGFIDPSTGRPYGTQEKVKQESAYQQNVYNNPPPPNKYYEQNNTQSMRCPRCGSNNVNVMPTTDVWSKNRGCIGWGLWILLAVCTCGIILLIIPLATNTKVKSKTSYEAVCQNCGHHWGV